MSSINDPEQLTGSSRIYGNAKPGIIMDAFSMAGESNLVFIINELDKAASGKGNGNPADVLSRWWRRHSRSTYQGNEWKV